MNTKETTEMLREVLQGIHANQVNILTGDNAHVSYESAAKTALTEDQKNTVARLKPIFYGNEEEARAFLLRVQDMKAVQITTLVNTLVSEKKISELSRHRDLYTVLNECGIYDKSESNWNQQVR